MTWAVQGSEAGECSCRWHVRWDWDFFALCVFLALPYIPPGNHFASQFPASIRLPSLFFPPRAGQDNHRQARGTKAADRDQFCPRKSCGTTVSFSYQKRSGVYTAVCGSQCVRTAHLPPAPHSESSLWWLETSHAGNIHATESGTHFPSGLPRPRK